ncbi:MAG: matrixin family metalloprotease [Planctomycetia bacterium]|nr:matrixin family metalloprotease [Planctomycetia bacterium]
MSTIAGGSNGLAITGNADIDGAISGVTNYSVSGTSNIGANVTTTGTQIYTGAVTLSGADRTLAGTTIQNVSTIAGGSNGLAITGNADVDGAITGVTNYSVSGTASLGANVTTTGMQTYTGAVTLTAAVSLNSNGGNILLSSTLAGGSQDLTIAAGTAAGTTTFTGAVSGMGDGTGAAITIASTGLARFMSTVGGGSGIVSTNAGGSTRFDGDVTLTNGDTGSSFAGTTTLDGLNWSGFDGLTFTGAVTMSSGSVSLNSNGGAILLSSTLAGGGQDLTIAAGTAAGTTTFTGAVSGMGDGTGAAITIASTGLARFMSTVGGGSGIVSSNGSGSTRFDNNVTLTDGDTASSFAGTTTLDGLNWSGFDGLTFTGAVTMSGGAVSLDSNGGNILFSSTIATGGFALSLDADAAGNVTLSGALTGGGAMTVVDGAVQSYQGLTVGSLDIQDATTSVTFNAATNITSSVSVVSGGTIVNSAKMTAGTTVVFDAGDNITINGAIDPTTVTMTSDDDILINAAVEATDLISLTAGQDNSGGVTVSGTGSLTVTASGSDVTIITGTTSGNIALAGNVTAVDRLTLTSSGTAIQSGATILAANLLALVTSTLTLDQASNDFDTVAVATDGGVVTLRDTDGIAVGTVGATSGIDTGSTVAGGAVTINANGLLNVTQAINTNTGTGGGISITGNVTVGAVVTAAGGNITLNGNAGADQDLDINANLVSATSMVLSATRDIFIGALVQTTASGADITITADSDSIGNGGVQVELAGQVDAKDVATLSGSDLNATAGTVAVDINADGTNAQVLAGGNVSISSNATTSASSIIIDGLVSASGTGTITVTANRDVTFVATGDLTAAGGAISVTADNFAGNNGGVIMQANGSVINGGTATVTLSADGSVTLGSVTTTNAGTTAVSITSTSGGVVDGGDTDVDIVANNATARTTITTATGIGHAAGVGGAADNAIDTQITILDASVTGTGSIDIDETDAINLLDVDTFNGAITVDAGGTITATDVQSTADSDTVDIILQTSAGGIILTSVKIGTGTAATAGDVYLNAATSITESTVNTAVKIIADSLRLVTGTGGVASEVPNGSEGVAQHANLLDTTINELEASIGASGLFLVNTQALTLIDQDLLGTGNDGLDRDDNAGTTAITSNSGTVRVNTTVGSLTFGELVNASSQLASFNAVGLFSDADGDSSSSDVNADRVAFRSTNGIGTTSNAVEINETNVTNGLAFVNSTAGDVSIRDVAGGLIINDVDALTASSNTTGVVTITALSPLTVDHNVTASGNILMTATDSAGAGDNLTVTTTTMVVSTGGDVTLQAGDDLFLIDSSTVSATAADKKVTLRGDFGNADALIAGVNPGSTMHLYGTIASNLRAEVYGNSDDDTIDLNPGSVHFTSSILLDGGEGSDTYVVQFGKLTAGTMSVYVNDSGTGDDDFLTTNGTSAPEQVNVFNNVLNGSDLSGGYVQNTPLSGTPSEQVNYSGNLERLLVHGQDGDDFFHVRPSQTAKISINGGNSNFGPGLTANPFAGMFPLPADVKGDALDLQTLNNTFNFIGTTFFVDGGTPATFKGISIRNLEYVPLIPLATAAPLRFDFDGSAISPDTQAGYTSVVPGRVYGSGTTNADFGWVSTAANYVNRGDVLSSSFENLLQDAHFDEVARTFRVDVSDLVADPDAPQANGWYLVSLTFGDASASRSGVQVRNGDSNYLLLTTPNTVAGQFVTETLVIQVFDGTLDLKFQSATADPRWQVTGMEIQPGKILTFGSPDPGSLVADGLTEDTFIGYEATPGALVTVRPGIDTSGDEIPDADLVVTSPDQDPNLAGVQRLVGVDGLFTYTIRRPSVAGSGFVSFEALSPTAVTETGSLAIDYVLPSVRRYDFNSGVSPTQTPVATPSVPAGYVGVLPTDLKTPTNGYGWVTSPTSLDRGAGLGDAQADLRRDGATGTTPRTFQTQLSNGTYFVNVTLGDKSATRDNMQVTVNGTLRLPDVDTAGGQFFHSMFTATTSGGLLSFDFNDAGGSDPTWVVNGLEIRAGAQVNQATSFVSNNPGSQSADGSTVDTITVNFPSALPAGTLFTVSSSLGTIVSSDASTEYQGTQVLGSGTSFTFQVQRPSSGGTPTFTVTAVDGSAYGTANSAAVLAYAAPPQRRFDFNTATSPTQTPTNPPTGSGYQGVTPATLYSAGQGYGWDGTAPSSFDRGATGSTSSSDLVRDGAISSVGTRDFRIDNLGALTTYTATVTMGDLSAFHDLMNVSVVTGTGAGASGITTASGTVVQSSFTATSSAAGTLVFRFADAGGSDASWVVNALELYANVASIVVTSPGGSLTADGSTIDTFAITSGLVSGQVYTVTASAGTLVQSGGAAFADSDTVFSGNQFTATGTSANLFLKRPTGTSTSVVTVTQLTGQSSGSASQSYAAAAVRRFDFISSSGVSPNDTATGFIGVKGTDLYSAAGYGFLTAASDDSKGVNSVSNTISANGKKFYEDFVKGTVATGARTFQVSVLPATTYSVRVYSGDSTAAHDKLAVQIEGKTIVLGVSYYKSLASTAAGSFGNLLFTGITDQNGDGKLNIVFQDLSTTGDTTWVVNGLDVWPSTATDPGVQAQSSAGTVFAGSTAADLTTQALAPIVTEAVARWSVTGLTAAEIAMLRAITFQITDLDAQHELGLASELLGQIQLDDNANGHDWFVDGTPRDNREFARRGVGMELTALPNGPAAGHMDLLTVVMHEMGHLLGRDHSANPRSLMAEELATGLRRLPAPETLATPSHFAISTNKVESHRITANGFQVTASAAANSKFATLHSAVSAERSVPQLTTSDQSGPVNERKRHETRDQVFAEIKNFFTELESSQD